jgi:hypothetical protein
VARLRALSARPAALPFLPRSPRPRPKPCDDDDDEATLVLVSFGGDGALVSTSTTGAEVVVDGSVGATVAVTDAVSTRARLVGPLYNDKHEMNDCTDAQHVTSKRQCYQLCVPHHCYWYRLIVAYYHLLTCMHQFHMAGKRTDLYHTSVGTVLR